MPYPVKPLCKNGHDISVVGRTKHHSCRQCLREATQRWRLRNIGLVKEQARLRNLRLRGIAKEDEYQELVRLQDGLCAVCRKEAPLRHGERRLHIDHSHLTGERRGLLCQRCNLAIGHFQDSIDLLKAAIAYLEKWDATKEGIIEQNNCF